MELLTSPANRVGVLINVFSRIADRTHFDQIESKLSDEELAEVRDSLGILYTFDPGNPTGHYVLDLSKKVERMLCSRLMEINNDEKVLRKSAGLADTSQNGTRD